MSNENILTLWASRRTGRPVKWVAEHSEAFLADDHGRDNVTDAELALDKDGRFLALRVRTLCNLGAYVSANVNVMPTFMNLGTLAGVYMTPAIQVSVLAVLTNTALTASCRGAGRPEACYVIEGIIDRAARELGIDRTELRRRNMIPPSVMPFKTGLLSCGVRNEYKWENVTAVFDASLKRVSGYPCSQAQSGLVILEPGKSARPSRALS